MIDFSVKRGDRRPIKIKLKDGAKAPVPLTTATTVKFFMRLVGASANKINGSSMSIEDAAQGIVKYAPSATDFDAVGTYEAEVEVTFSGTETPQTFPSERDENITIEVTQDLG